MVASGGKDVLGLISGPEQRPEKRSPERGSSNLEAGTRDRTNELLLSRLPRSVQRDLPKYVLRTKLSTGEKNGREFVVDEMFPGRRRKRSRGHYAE